MVAAARSACAGYKTINGHGLSGHHVSTTIRFNVRGVNKLYSYLLDFPSGEPWVQRVLQIGRVLLEWKPHSQQARELVVRGVGTRILPIRPVDAQARLNKYIANQVLELLLL